MAQRLGAEHGSFQLWEGPNWRIGFDAAATQPDNFTAVITSDQWSFTLTQREFGDFVQARRFLVGGDQCPACLHHEMAAQIRALSLFQSLPSFLHERTVLLMVSAALQLVSLQDMCSAQADLEPILGHMGLCASSAPICGGQHLPLAAASARLHHLLSMQGGKVKYWALSQSFK